MAKLSPDEYRRLLDALLDQLLAVRCTVVEICNALREEFGNS